MGLALASLLSLGAGLCGLLYSPLLLLVAPLALLAFRPSLGLAFGVLLIPFALTPEMEGDSIMYQVPMAIRNLHYHKYLFSADNIMSAFPGAFDSILALMPENGRLLNCLVLTACCASLYSIRPWAGLVGVLALLSFSPVWHLIASSKPDLMCLLLSLGGAIAWRKKPWVSGFLFGSACMAKLSFAPVAICACALGGWKALAGMGLACAPWMAYLWLSIGTPAFPLIQSVFSLSFFPKENSELLRETISKGRSFYGDILTIFISMPFAWAIAVFSKTTLPLAGAAGMMLTLLFFPSSPRYLLPALPLLLVPGIQGMGKLTIGWLLFSAVLAIPAIFTAFFSGYPLEGWASYHGTYRMLRNERLLMIGEERKYPYFNPEGFAPGLDNPSVLKTFTRYEATTERIRIRLKQKRITAILFYGRGFIEARKHSVPILLSKEQTNAWNGLFNGGWLVSLDLDPDAMLYPLTKRTYRETLRQEDNK